MPESWTTLLEPLDDLEVSPDLRAQVEARRRHEAVTGEDATRPRLRRLALAGAAALAVVVFVVVMVIAAHSRRDRPTPAHAPPDRTNPSSVNRKFRFGEPVELDGMTFVAKELVMVGSVPIPNDRPNDQPLKAPAGSRLWVLTVSVRNDGETPAHEPFCHGRDRLGAELTSIENGGGVWWYHGWSKDSLVIDPNHQFCNDIPPGSTETFQLLFYVANGQGKVNGVLLQHRSSPADHFSYAFVTR